MSVVLDGLREITKDTTSHLTVAGLVTFAHENKYIGYAAAVGSVLLAVAWGYHLYKVYHERKTAAVPVKDK